VGFFRGRDDRGFGRGAIEAVITPREYRAFLAGALRLALDGEPRESDTGRPCLAEGAASGLIEGLSRRVRHRPDDPAGHRRLAVVYLHAGHDRLALRHLEIAARILLVQAAMRGGLQHALSVRLQLALLAPILLPLCLRRGRPATARRLVSQVLATL